MERIEPHVSLEYADRPLRISRKDKGPSKAPVHVVGIEHNGSFKLRYGRIVLAHPDEDKSENGVSVREVRIERYGLARVLMREVDGVFMCPGGIGEDAEEKPAAKG